MSKHADMPDLRPGCFPAKDWRHPPHDASLNRDHLRIGIIHPDQFDEVPCLAAVTQDDPYLEIVSGTVYEVLTGNGMRCYVQSESDLLCLIQLAAAGHGGVLKWMYGAPYHGAWRFAQANYAPLSLRSVPPSTDKSDKPDLSDLSIEI